MILLGLEGLKCSGHLTSQGTTDKLPEMLIPRDSYPVKEVMLNFKEPGRWSIGCLMLPVHTALKLAYCQLKNI